MEEIFPSNRCLGPSVPDPGLTVNERLTHPGAEAALRFLWKNEQEERRQQDVAFVLKVFQQTPGRWAKAGLHLLRHNCLTRVKRPVF